jgi:hypothetical protein
VRVVATVVPNEHLTVSVPLTCADVRTEIDLPKRFSESAGEFPRWEPPTMLTLKPLVQAGGHDPARDNAKASGHRVTYLLILLLRCADELPVIGEFLHCGAFT